MDAYLPDERFRRLTPELLASVPDDELSDAILHHVVLRMGNETTRKREVVRACPVGVRAVFATLLVDLEVNNGGFNQLFWNPSGEFAGDALAGYELMGAEDYASVMRAAIATWESEREILAPFHEEGTLEAFSESYQHTSLGDLDGRYYALNGRIAQIWSRFVRARPELFFTAS